MIVGLGVDLVEIERVERLLADKGERALRRLFRDGEVAYAMARARPELHLAGRLAAKEAAFKALAGSDDARGIGWRELEIVNGRDGRPELRLHGRAQSRWTEMAATGIWLTITHSRQTACAVVVIER